MKQNGKKALKAAVVTSVAAITALSAFSFVGCNSAKEEGDGFKMTYELACKLNHDNFGVEEEDSANYGGDRVYGYKYLEDGYIRMADPENVQEDDPVNFYNIVKNFTITKPDLDEFGNELTTSREYNIWGMFQVPLWFRPEWIDEPGDRSFPLAIECHGFNTTSGGFQSAKWANTWTEKGYICYAFDFVGGAPGPNWENGTKSGPKVLDEARGDKGELVDRTGQPLDERPEYVKEFPKDKPMWDYYGGGWMEMSVATEVQDLHCVIDEVKKLDVVDEEHISLMGQSQGGVVCAVTAAEYGIYTILDLHGAYGSQNGQDHSGQIIASVGDVNFYSDENLKNLTVKLWKELSLHFKDNGSVAGYDILNEPGEKAGVTGKLHWDFYDEVYEAIRDNGDNHIVIFESCWDGKNLPQPSDYGWENCVYSFHHYAGDKLNYPAYCASWNKKIEEVEAMQFGVPLQMGEFTNYTAIENWKYSLNLLNTSGWHWTNWTYKVWGNMPWGVINIRGTADEKVNAADDEYEDILLKFQRLSTSQGERYTFADGTTLESLLSEYIR